jgi:hypothetical protein
MPEKISVQDGDLEKSVNHEMHVRDYRAYRLIYFFLGVIEVMLALRFFFKLAAANPGNFFVSIIYVFTTIFLLPFQTIFPIKATEGDVVVRLFEPSIFVAMIVYALVAFGISKLLFIIKTKPKNEKAPIEM